MELIEDGYVNAVTNFGTRRDSSQFYRYEAEPIIPDVKLALQYESDGLFAKIIDRPAEEAFKNGYELDGLSDADIKNALKKSATRLNVDECFVTAMKWARLFGGALVVMICDDGGELTEPLNKKRLKGIDELLVFDRSQVTPDYTSMYRASAIDKETAHKKSSFGKPEFFDVSSEYGGFRVHESRCPVFKNGKMPSITHNGTYRYWGIPELLRIQKELRQVVTTSASGVDMMEKSVQPVYAMVGLSELTSTEGGTEKVAKRLENLDLCRNLRNTMVVDAEGESYEFKTSGSPNVTQVLESVCGLLSAVTNIPQTLLFGRSPAGMNATGESDMENYYSFVARLQKTICLPNLEYLFDLLFLSERNAGTLKEIPAFDIVFNPLKQKTQEEEQQAEQTRASIAQTRAATAQIYVNLGVMKPEEVRRALASDKPFDIDTALDELSQKEIDAPIGQKEGKQDEST